MDSTSIHTRSVVPVLAVLTEFHISIQQMLKTDLKALAGLRP